MLSIDVEEWYQTENFHGILPRERWPEQESRVAASTDRILAALDERGYKATFFVLGCVAEQHPGLVRAIAEAGHELACHGYGHELIYRQTPQQFREDVVRGKGIIESASGTEVRGYRAPAYSITEWAVDILCELGFQYDSSLFPVTYHDRYGRIELDCAGRQVVPLRAGFHEVTVSTLDLFGKRLPWAGGGYFRLLPYSVFAAGIRRILRRQGSYLFYFHPPEIDPDQPVMPGLSRPLRFRQYVGLKRNEGKVRRLLADHAFVGIAEGLKRLGVESEAPAGGVARGTA